MPKLRNFLFGPWRAVPVLGVTQILAWGALYYPPVLMMPLIAFFAWVFLGETLSIKEIWGLVLVGAGVLIVQGYKV